MTSSHFNSRSALAWWLLAGALFIGTSGIPSLRRSQEARVLETARTMVGTQWRDWMIPRVNGRVRLQKPPLAYWLSAASFALFGPDVWAGRLPMAIGGWLALGVTWRFARDLCNARAALLAAAVMLGALVYARLGQHAETDTLANLFATTAAWALWRAWEINRIRSASTTPAAGGQSQTPEGPSPRPSPLSTKERENGVGHENAIALPAAGGSDIPWHHLAAAAIALTILAKGAPAVFPVLFLLGLMVVGGGWRTGWRFVISGAPLTLAAIALPWFIYIANMPESAVLAEELGVAASGRGHARGPFFYLLRLFVQAAPWSAFLALALVVAAGRWRSDIVPRVLIAWLLAVLVPLTLIGQKQEHYLIFALPAVSMLVGWVIDLALRRMDEDRPLADAARWMTFALLFKAALAIPILLVAGHMYRRIMSIDILFALVALGVAGAGFMLHRRRGLIASAPAAVIGMSALMNLLVSAWAPSLEKLTRADVAQRLRQTFGDGPYAFYRTESLSVVFHMRQTIPDYDDESLAEAVAAKPDLVIIVEDSSERKRQRLSRFQHQMTFDVTEDRIDIYRGLAGGVRAAQPDRKPANAATSPASRARPASAR